MHFVFLTALYLVFAEPTFATANPSGVMLVVASLALYGASAVLVNDYFDIPSDMAAGKKRAIYYVAPRYLVVLFFSLTALGFASVILAGGPLLVLLYSTMYALALSYSVPPFRFKGRGYLSLAVDVLVEKPLPGLLLFVYFQHIGIDAVVFVLLALATHTAVQVRHQLEDYKADADAGTKTFVVVVGSERASRLLYRGLFRVSAFLGVVVLFLIALAVRSYFVAALVLAAVGYPLIMRLRALNLYSQDRSRVPEWHRKDEAPMPSYFAYTLMCLTSASPILMGVLAVMTSLWWLPLLLAVVASQYYYLRLHYWPIARGGLLLLQRLLRFGSPR
jgi:1,4-dihydroxy-2-naphthoate octaprenyltransferase